MTIHPMTIIKMPRKPPTSIKAVDPIIADTTKIMSTIDAANPPNAIIGRSFPCKVVYLYLSCPATKRCELYLQTGSNQDSFPQFTTVAIQDLTYTSYKRPLCERIIRGVRGISRSLERTVWTSRVRFQPTDALFW